MFGAAAAKPAVLNPNNDVQISPPMQDGISSLAFSPVANILVATSWDNSAYAWEISQSGQANAKASTSHSAPILCSAWNADGSAVFTGGCDKTVKLWNLATNQSQQVAAHDAPIRHCAYIPENNILVTGEEALRWSTKQRLHVLHPQSQRVQRHVENFMHSSSARAVCTSKVRFSSHVDAGKE